MEHNAIEAMNPEWHDLYEELNCLDTGIRQYDVEAGDLCRRDRRTIARMYDYMDVNRYDSREGRLHGRRRYKVERIRKTESSVSVSIMTLALLRMKKEKTACIK